MHAPQSSLLPDGRRLHLHHGPIDLIIEVWGQNRADAYAAATRRFQTILQELVDELPTLRTKVNATTAFKSSTARRMHYAVKPYAANIFVTPMAAVAGAVADEILAAMAGATTFDKGYVNNGGDTAFHLEGDAHIDALIAAPIPGHIRVAAEDPCRGVATSGWQGRSHSLGIADSVSVVASNAAAADVAATLIANAVDLPGHPAITRTPASGLSPDSDLSDRPVTTDVGHLPETDVDAALDAGMEFAQGALNADRIAGALLTLQSHSRHVGVADQIAFPERNFLNA